MKHYYVCGSRNKEKRLRCNGAFLRAEFLDERAWQHCRRFLENPGETLAAAQRVVRERLSASAHDQCREPRLREQLAATLDERSRVEWLFAKGRIDIARYDEMATSIDRRAAALEDDLRQLGRQAERAQQYEKRLHDLAEGLRHVRARLYEMDEPDRADEALKREIMRLLIAEIKVTTDPDSRAWPRPYTIDWAFTFGSPPSDGVMLPTRTRSSSARPA